VGFLPFGGDELLAAVLREGERLATAAAESLGGGLGAVRQQAETLIAQGAQAYYREIHQDTDGADVPADVTEAKTVRPGTGPGKVPERAGWVNDIPEGGLNEYQAGMGASTQTDRRSLLRELWEAYLSCPWSWACVTAISRTITAGGLVMDWDNDEGEGDQEAPDKPAEVLAFERLTDFCNPRHDIRQLLRNTVADLEVFGDAFIEVVWWGNLPVALFNLDAPTTTPLADAHGDVSGYVQVTDNGQRASFKPREVIHISLDSARPGVFGVSPTQAALLPITTWLFAAAAGKEMFKKGLPPNIHADLAASTSQPEMRKWDNQYRAGNLGVKNIGAPITTKGGGKVAELQSGKIADVISGKNQSRDEIVSSYGVPPAKVGIIESGNLGGGTGSDQNRTYELDTCEPIAQLILEKLQFHLVVQAFGITGWHVKFGEVDYRSEADVETIRDQRLRNGSWTLNKYRATIGEPPVEGGDDAVLVDRQNLVLWKDMARMSEAQVASKGAPAVAAGEAPPGGEPLQAGQQPAGQEPPVESLRVVQLAAYRKRLREAMKHSPLTEATHPAVKSTGDAVYAQLARNFPPSALSWVRDAEWEGPVRVPEDHIDMADRDQWNASHDGTVPKYQAKLRRKQANGGHLKPVILIRRPGSDRDLIADGHHRVLASLAEGEMPWAYIGRVKTDKGPWDQLALSQEPEGKAA
jgi:HK97 family phage portal protein